MTRTLIAPPPAALRGSDVHELGAEVDPVHPPLTSERVEIGAGLGVARQALQRGYLRSQATPDETRRRARRLDVHSGHARPVDGDDVGPGEVAAAKETEHDFSRLGDQVLEAVHRLPDRVREPEEDHVVSVEAVQTEEERICDRRGIALDDERAVLPRPFGDVQLLGPGDDAQLVAESRLHPFDQVVQHGASADGQHLLRAGQGLQACRVPGRGDDADDSYRKSLRRIC